MIGTEVFLVTVLSVVLLPGEAFVVTRRNVRCSQTMSIIPYVYDNVPPGWVFLLQGCETDLDCVVAGVGGCCARWNPYLSLKLPKVSGCDKQEDVTKYRGAYLSRHQPGKEANIVSTSCDEPACLVPTERASRWAGEVRDVTPPPTTSPTRTTSMIAIDRREPAEDGQRKYWRCPCERSLSCMAVGNSPVGFCRAPLSGQGATYAGKHGHSVTVPLEDGTELVKLSARTYVRPCPSVSSGAWQPGTHPANHRWRFRSSQVELGQTRQLVLGRQWRNGRMLDSQPRGPGFES
ncbi:activation of MAPK [Branchiostoma belcheri]|nr:activation of MAPK [Branchiostoma belcheri]